MIHCETRAPAPDGTRVGRRGSNAGGSALRDPPRFGRFRSSSEQRPLSGLPRLLALAPLLAGLVIAHPAQAGILPNAIVMDTGYAAGPVEWDIDFGYIREGDPLWIVGPVLELHAPFEDVLPPAGPYEVTYAFTDLVCTATGMWDDLDHNKGGWFAEFGGGKFRVYLDESPDADFANPATFQDGELLVEAQSMWFVLGTEPTQLGYFRFTGGSLFDRVSKDGVGYIAENLGSIDGDVPAALEAFGYGARSSGAIDVHVPVPVEETTWGQVKALYR